MLSQADRFAFIAEWYDPNASLFRRYELLYYPKDGSVEMYDVKNHRTFLKRTKYDSLHLEDLFVGNKITIFSRHLSLVDYGDQYTARKLGSRKERTLALIKPDAAPKMGELIDIIINAGFTVTKAKMMALSRKEAIDFYVDHQSKPFYNELLQFVTSGPIVAMEILGDDAVSKWKTLLGPANSAVARTDAPDSIRANFGHDGLRNAAHGPDSVASAAQELELFFPSSGGHGPVNSAKFTNCTCCIIKPHAVNEGLTGKIIKAIISEGFQISALQMFNLERANVEEFYEIYKGVVTEYLEMVTELCSGPCIAMEIIQPEPPKAFRDFCGPSDPSSQHQCFCCLPLAVLHMLCSELPGMHLEAASCLCLILKCAGKLGIFGTSIAWNTSVLNFHTFLCMEEWLGEIARHLRPGTLRAVFGKNKIQNAVHCTDLPEDGLLEVSPSIAPETSLPANSCTHFCRCKRYSTFSRFWTTNSLHPHPK
ncbi:nucleoside diphosphate kinase homolog 7 isoform X2 [Apteryx mantelli]|uniref:Nucleoside diphosphate kinase 7 isoform X2 n=1 Tax=Apteryx mantelli TaxID=2696672 RepID=A0A8B7J347_9AVES|nr:PREDICTED: nucleoside diphosphate kinase 7 isoform X2 [Apteryx mantelli mantelli]